MFVDETPTVSGFRRAQPEPPRRTVRQLTPTERALYFAVVPVDVACGGYALVAAIFDLPHVPDPFAPYFVGGLLLLTMALIAKKMRAAADEDIAQLTADVAELLERQQSIVEHQAAVATRAASPPANGRVYVAAASTAGMDPATVEALDRINLRLVPPGDAG